MTQAEIPVENKSNPKKHKYIQIVLGLLIALVLLFLYLFLTKNPLLWNVPLLPDRMLTPDFLFHFDSAGLDTPRGVSSDPFDNVYVADNRNRRVRVFDKNGRAVNDFGQEHLEAPFDLVAHNGAVFVTDHIAGMVQRFNFGGSHMGTILASGDEDLGLFRPTGITADPDTGNLYITDIAEHRVIVATRDGEVLFEFGGTGEAEGSFAYPGGIALDADKNIYVADGNNARVQVFNPDGTEVLYVIYGGSADNEQLSRPGNVAVDRNGYIWITDTFSHRVFVFNGEQLMTSFGGLGIGEGELYFPYGLDFDDNGNIYVTERALGRISVFGYPTLTSGR
ncbi:NHL repeat-containing protein [Dethiobacter alkaliphilus]|uniref:NHL repeat containing protein n=1 Tax=Dethiobacter alkaliphilus AHT 1 TaxID=555088 RepID=C0GG20_DETAL|nr:NHL repeat-containing protein [Dethiobacter alkaliphilus]EEG77709.1 NHL repeat containing protein [Dethiobacter alkaliphilus AHT 1]